MHFVYSSSHLSVHPLARYLQTPSVCPEPSQALGEMAVVNPTWLLPAGWLGTDRSSLQGCH